jgi:hypothetical protein
MFAPNISGNVPTSGWPKFLAVLSDATGLPTNNNRNLPQTWGDMKT